MKNLFPILSHQYVVMT